MRSMSVFIALGYRSRTIIDICCRPNPCCSLVIGFAQIDDSRSVFIAEVGVGDVDTGINYANDNTLSFMSVGKVVVLYTM